MNAERITCRTGLDIKTKLKQKQIDRQSSVKTFIALTYHFNNKFPAEIRVTQTEQKFLVLSK